MPAVKSFLLGALLFSASIAGSSAATSKPHGPATYSPELLELLRAEMRELLVGVQAIAAALPAGDWEKVVATSRQIKASYVLEKKLTPALEKELTALPDAFRSLDRSFHARAEKLAQAAALKDAEATAFHYSRLLEACTACHSAFATTRFPGFAAPAHEEQHHH